MRALSLWQPWASLWCSPCKVHETRDWSFSHRGWLLVHATKKIVHEVDDDLMSIVDSEFGGHWGMDLPRGALIGAVNVVACKPAADVRAAYVRQGGVDDMPDDYHCGDFSDGRFAFERSDYKVFRRPIPYSGRQGPFDVPDHLVRDAMQEALAA